jgi:hypothetical protein
MTKRQVTILRLNGHFLIIADHIVASPHPGDLRLFSQCCIGQLKPSGVLKQIQRKRQPVEVKLSAAGKTDPRRRKKRLRRRTEESKKPLITAIFAVLDYIGSNIKTLPCVIIDIKHSGTELLATATFYGDKRQFTPDGLPWAGDTENQDAIDKICQKNLLLPQFADVPAELN